VHSRSEWRGACGRRNTPGNGHLRPTGRVRAARSFAGQLSTRCLAARPPVGPFVEGQRARDTPRFRECGEHYVMSPGTTMLAASPERRHQWADPTLTSLEFTSISGIKEVASCDIPCSVFRAQSIELPRACFARLPLRCPVESGEQPHQHEIDDHKHRQNRRCALQHRAGRSVGMPICQPGNGAPKVEWHRGHPTTAVRAEIRANTEY